MMWRCVAHSRCTARPLIRYRLFATTGLLLVGSVGFWLMTAGLPPPVGPAAAVRNLLGLTGLGLVGARLLGGRLAWILPWALVICVVSIASGTETAAGILVWPMRPDRDVGAGLVA